MTLCPCCMEEHDVQTIAVTENNIFKNMPVEYTAAYSYCPRADETYADERQLSSNDAAMKDAYRRKMGLLTSRDIASVRALYGISQSDLCLLLGWGLKTVTRYESHQVQDAAHDTILRKLAADPEWFLQLLSEAKSALSGASYEKYREAGTTLFEQNHDRYLKSAIYASYAGFRHNPDATGGTALSLDAVADMIRYYANAPQVTGLYLVKLMKLLWYGDALSYKRRGHTISGMAYRALPMGAVPVSYESIIDLNTIHYEEVDMGDGTGYRFYPSEERDYPHLTPEDTAILDAVIRQFGRLSKNELVKRMHREDAYTRTAPHEIIPFRFADTLSLS